MAQQTAVEWLEAKLKNIDYTTIDTSNFITCKIALHTFNKLFEKAKAMEKEQIKEAYNFGLLDEYVTPIELPSDEEIEKHFTIGVAPQTSYPHMIQGAKWLKEQILNK